jgi:ferredoxin-thioredoxin reductase catalytic subunit
LRITLNSNKEHVKKIREALNRNNNHCPCSIIKNDDTKCMCKEFRHMIENKEYGSSCHCNLYVISED